MPIFYGATLGGDYLRVKQAKVRGRCISHKTSPLILVNERGRDHYVGSDQDLDKLFQAELGGHRHPLTWLLSIKLP